MTLVLERDCFKRNLHKSLKSFTRYSIVSKKSVLWTQNAPN